MDITIVTTSEERKEYEKCVNARCEYVSNNITREEWEKFPKKVWVDVVDGGRGVNCPAFLVVDNSDGQCFVEEFETLDGAMLYASGIKLTTENQEDWDYMGALRDGGELIGREPE